MTDKDKLSREDLRADRAAPPRRGTFHRILVLVAVLAVVLGAVLAAAYLDLSNFDSLRRALSYDNLAISSLCMLVDMLWLDVIRGS